MAIPIHLHRSRWWAGGLFGLAVWLYSGCGPAAPPTSSAITIPVDTPRVELEQGIRGTVTATSGPAPEDGSPVVPVPQFGVRVVALDPVTKQVIAKTESGASGLYELRLLPGHYFICVMPDDRTLCNPEIVVPAGRFVTVDLGYGLQ